VTNEGAIYTLVCIAHIDSHHSRCLWRARNQPRECERQYGDACRPPGRTNRGIEANANPYRNPHASAYAIPYTLVDASRDHDLYANEYSCCDKHTNCYGHWHGNVNANRYGYSNRYANAHHDQYADAKANRYGYQAAYGYSYNHANSPDCRLKTC
jgi:hypothetical protein